MSISGVKYHQTVQDSATPYFVSDSGPESALQLYWESLNFPREYQTSDGRSITVIHGGAWNHNAGPDFTDALILTPEGLQTGDIEIHRMTSGWFAHGHHTDYRYSNVILHVLGQPSETVGFAGRDLPEYTIVLNPVCSDMVSPSKPQCQRNQIKQNGRAAVYLLGLERLFLKANTFQGESRRWGLPLREIWYKKTLRCLGYSPNASILESIARRLSLSQMTEIHYHLDVSQLLDFFLGLTGYSDVADLPTPSWDKFHRAFEMTSMKFSQWKPLQSRPVNHPVLRLTAFAVALQDYLMILDRRITDRSPKECLDALICSIELPPSFRDYFGVNTLTIGQSRATEIIVNSLLPYWIKRDHLDRETVAQWMNNFPVHPVYRHLRIFIQQTRWNDIVQDYRMNPLEIQGFLRLRSLYCEHLWCEFCPMLKEEDGFK